jgi:hypothetical protein
LFDLSRHKIILTSFFKAISEFSPGGSPLLLFLLVIYLSFHIAAQKSWNLHTLSLFLVLFIQFSGYYLTYLISPYDLAWHTAYSSTRLITHLYPGFLFLAVHAGKTPEEILPAGFE